ncbi:MAG: M15 family metallopeptidase [Candidatus Pacebacteria bacterium]|nr:M15 family metallopeptidase [Candidatus Paceibacterota bacterium]
MDRKTLAIYIILAISIIGNIYGYASNTKLDKNNSSLEETLSNKESDIANILNENELLLEGLENERAKNYDLQDRVQEAESQLGTLEKLQETDRELLQKYSKVYFLNEHYEPKNLRKVDQKYVVKSEEEYIHIEVYPFLKDLLREAEKDGVDLRVISAFRSYNEQKSLKSSYTVTYGSGANTFSADQGYSEHQLGTTVDFSTEDLGTNYEAIGKTRGFRWLEDNAHKYGFTLSYPENNQYYQYEPWHWRFVGIELASYLNREKIHFYDMDQRDINEYLIELFN